jgi:hypothetical protein
MSYEFESISYPTRAAALEAVARAWIYGVSAAPYPETLEEAPAQLAAECVAEWDLRDLLAEWGADAPALAAAMASVLAAARAESGQPGELLAQIRDAARVR